MPYEFTAQDVELPYQEFKKLCNQVKDDLGPNNKEWLGIWEQWDLAVSPMPDEVRQKLRLGHWFGYYGTKRRTLEKAKDLCEEAAYKVLSDTTVSSTTSGMSEEGRELVAELIAKKLVELLVDVPK